MRLEICNYLYCIVFCIFVRLNVAALFRSYISVVNAVSLGFDVMHE